MIALVGLHFLVGLAITGLGDRIGRRAFVVGALAPAATVIWLGTRVGSLRDGAITAESTSWVEGLGLGIDLRLDGLAAVMVALVSGLGVLVMAYAGGYFGSRRPGRARLAGLLVCFSGSMLGLVLADNLLLLATFWELTAVTSFLLIGDDHTAPRARAAALQAFLTTGLGGLAMLGGFLLLGHEAGTFRLSEILADPPRGGASTWALLLVLVGAATKSAQYPFGAWLPEAMVAPTPVSAYLHSATMVKAGVYLVARCALPFADSPGWRPAVVSVGAVTMLAGGVRALRQTDLKLLLAFGTISQLGFMFVLFGVGTPAAVDAGSVLLVGHALFKVALFMGVGMLDRGAGTRDLDALPTLERGWWPVISAMVVSAGSMAGLPPTLGFVAKESAYDALWRDASFGGRVVLAVVVVSSMVTFAYSARLVVGAFVVPRRAGRPRSNHGPAAAFVAPMVVAAIATVVGGVAPFVLDVAVGGTAALVLTVLAVVGGVALHLVADPVARVVARGSVLPTGTAIHEAALRRLEQWSAAWTRVVQSGSLPVYAGVVLATAAVLPLVALAGSAGRVPRPPWAAGPAQVVLVALVLGAAVGAAASRRRFAAALFLGLAGYGMSGLFVAAGAPDLALTQVAIETLTTVLFVLVLRRLPDRFERTPGGMSRLVRVAVAGGVGLMVFVFALVAAGERIGPPVSDRMVDRALPDGGGRNVVNVILVDFRGFDTLGEITVLAAAAIGAVALARAGRRPGAPVAPVPGAVLRRVVHLDQSVSVVFYVMMAASVYLLLAGHHQPGGGFVGGLVAGAAVALRYVSGGIDEVRRVSPLPPWTIIGSGLLTSGACALVPVLAGHPVLDNGYVVSSVPLIGEVKLSSALAFDLGVYLVVVGLVLMVVEAFGERFGPADHSPEEIS